MDKELSKMNCKRLSEKENSLQNTFMLSDWSCTVVLNLYLIDAFQQLQLALGTTEYCASSASIQAS